MYRFYCSSTSFVPTVMHISNLFTGHMKIASTCVIRTFRVNTHGFAIEIMATEKVFAWLVCALKLQVHVTVPCSWAPWAPYTQGCPQTSQRLSILNPIAQQALHALVVGPHKLVFEAIFFLLWNACSDSWCISVLPFVPTLLPGTFLEWSTRPASANPGTHLDAVPCSYTR
jgi:hypothetical protein